MIHVAVLFPKYIDAILEGRKTVEARLSITRRVPFRAAAPGDQIYFKQRSGPLRAVATIARAEYFESLTPADLLRLGERFSRLILSPETYWKQDKARCRYASFFWLEQVRAVNSGPPFRPFYGDAWQTLASQKPRAVSSRNPSPRRGEDVVRASRATGEGASRTAPARS